MLPPAANRESVSGMDSSEKGKTQLNYLTQDVVKIYLSIHQVAEAGRNAHGAEKGNQRASARASAEKKKKTKGRKHRSRRRLCVPIMAWGCFGIKASEKKRTENLWLSNGIKTRDLSREIKLCHSKRAIFQRHRDG